MTRADHLPRLVVMTRFPTPGAAKTRLAASLGDEEAARLHSEIARYCVRRMHAVELSGDVELEVRADGASPRQVRTWLGRDVRVVSQGPGELGARLAEAARAAFASGAPVFVAVGSDAPDASGSVVRAALHALDGADVAIGPARDGGYYLIAINAAVAHRAIPAFFDDGVPWGTSDVLSSTLDRAAAAELSVAELDLLDDVDRPEDLHVWRRVLADEERIRRESTVSVVMPAIDEERHVGEAAESALAAGVHEVIVVDGGSTDSTAERARAAGAVVREAARGRAMQVNAGAETAVGDVLLFLHADSRLPSSAVADIAQALGDADVAMGAFQFNAGGGHARDRFMSWAGRMRHRAFGLPYGDQGQFLRRRDFEDLGGMPQIPVMEEWELARRCARLGRIATTSSRVWTSGRAWHEHGVATVVAVNAAVIAGYRLGVDPEDLARWRAGIAPGRRPNRGEANADRGA